jgi:hypothetical protein
MVGNGAEDQAASNFGRAQTAFSLRRGTTVLNVKVKIE